MNSLSEKKLFHQIDELQAKVQALYASSDANALNVELAFEEIDDRLRQIMNPAKGSDRSYSTSDIQRSVSNWFKVNLRTRINKLKLISVQIEEYIENLSLSNFNWQLSHEEYLVRVQQIDLSSEFSPNNDEKVNLSDYKELDFNSTVEELKFYSQLVEDNLQDAQYEYLAMLKEMEPYTGLKLKKGYNMKDIYFLIQVLLKAVSEDQKAIKTKAANLLTNTFYAKGDKFAKPKTFLNYEWDGLALSSTAHLIQDLQDVLENEKRDLKLNRK
jgi:hypothetical protein